MQNNPYTLPDVAEATKGGKRIEGKGQRDSSGIQVLVLHTADTVSSRAAHITP